MFPVLFSLGPVTIYTFGLFLVLAFLVTGGVFWRKGREEHYAEDELFDAFLLTLLWGLLWARIGFVMLHFSHFGLHPIQWLDIFSSPGVEPLFGLVPGAIFLYRYARKQKWNAFEVLDYAALALSAGSVILWLGAFFAGSSFGNTTGLPWGMTFPGVFDKRHPVQLYAALAFFLLYLFLGWAEYHYRTFEWYRDKKHSAQTGFLFAVFCVVYGVIGVALSFVRPAQIVLFDTSFDVPVRMVVLLFGSLVLYHRSGRSFLFFKKSSPTPIQSSSTS